MTHYIHDEKNNRIEGMSKEEIYALLAAAIQQGQLPSVDEDTAFVTMFKSIVDGKTYKMAFCTQAQYNQLEAQGLLETDAYYIITDDTSYDDIINYINNLVANVNGAKVDKSITNSLGTSQSIINDNEGLKLKVEDIDGNYCEIIIKENEIQLINHTTNPLATNTKNLFTLLNYFKNLFTPSTNPVTITDGKAYVTEQGLYSINYTSSTGTVNCKAIVSVDGNTLGTYYVPNGLNSSDNNGAISISTSGSNYRISVGSGTITACKRLIGYW